jgi:hypothetical protein
VFGYHPSNGTLWVGTNSGTQFAVNRWATVTPARDWTFLVGRFGLSTSPDDKADVFGYHPSNGTLSVGVNEGSEFAFTELRSVTPPQGWIFMVGNIGIWQIGPRNVLEDTPIGYYPGNGTLWAASTLPDAGSR